MIGATMISACGMEPAKRRASSRVEKASLIRSRTVTASTRNMPGGPGLQGIDAQFGGDAVEGAFQLLADGIRGRSQLVGQLGPGAAMGALLGEVAFLWREAEVGLLEQVAVGDGLAGGVAGVGGGRQGFLA